MAATLVGQSDGEIAWLRPTFIVCPGYVHRLPEDEFQRFGTDYIQLMGRKGLALVYGDTFEWGRWGIDPAAPNSTIGKYLGQFEEI